MRQRSGPAATSSRPTRRCWPSTVLRSPRLQKTRGCFLNFEAAVAGGIPVIKALRESLTGNTVSRVYGIMNGTCNYILTRMWDEGISFEDCLADAQRLGYAEADPTFDIEGNLNTAHKLAILTSSAFSASTILRLTTSISKASAIFRSPTSRRQTNSATASSSWVLH